MKENFWTKATKIERIHVLLYSILFLSFLLSLLIDNIIAYFIVLIVLIIINKNITSIYGKQIKSPKPEQKLGERINWWDQARGLGIILLLAGGIAQILSNIEGYPPLAPTWLAHGYYYIQIEGWPQIVTFNDLGKTLFSYMVGFNVGFSYYRRVEKYGELNSQLQNVRRFTSYITISVIYFLIDKFIGFLINNNLSEMSSSSYFSNLFLIFKISHLEFFEVFMNGIIATVAWSTLLATIILKYTKHKPKFRIIIAAILMIVHMILLEIPVTRDFQWVINNHTIFATPFFLINNLAITLIGMVYYDYFALNTEEKPFYGIKKGVMPIAMYAFAGGWLLSFIQPGDYFTSNTVITLLSIGFGNLLTVWIYAYGRGGFKFPLLSEYGKNMVFFFLLFFFYLSPWEFLLGKYEWMLNPWILMIFFGALPFILSGLLGIYMDKKKIYIKL